MSTSWNRVGSPTSKKFNSCVRPGVTDVRAIALRPVTALMSELLPTFERPAKATSGKSASGRKSSEGAESRNSTRPENSRRASSRRSGSSISVLRPCERSEASRNVGAHRSGSLPRYAPRNDGGRARSPLGLVPVRRSRLVGSLLLGRRLELRVLRIEVFLLRQREDVGGDPVEQQARRERRHHEH